MGFLKAGSRASLIASVIFAAALSLCAVGIINKVMVDVLLACLLVVFGIRLAKTRKAVPSGVMLGVTVVVLALRHLL